MTLSARPRWPLDDTSRADAGQRQTRGQGMSVAVLGAGAFGTALAISLARRQSDVTLWARDSDHAATMQSTRRNATRLPGIRYPTV